MTRTGRWLCMLFLLPAMAWAAATPIPPLHDPVVDTVPVLSTEQAAQLRAQALDLQARHGAQLQILVVDSTGDDGIEAYAQRVFDQWQIGRKDVDDGVLLVLAMGDRRVRIQTGYGLEGAIPDAYAQRIIDQAMVPQLRQGKPGQALIDGSGLLVGLIDGEPLPPVDDEPGVVRMPQDWRRGDSIVGLALLAGFLLGTWARRAPQRGVVSRWWHRPVQMLAVVGVAAAACAVFTPGATAALAIAMGTLVPIATLLGWLWLDSRRARWVLSFLLAAAVVASAVSVWKGKPVPSLALHLLLVTVLAIAVGLIWLWVAALRNSWRTGRLGFFVRLVFLCGLSAVYAWLVHRTHAQYGHDPGTVMLIAGGFFLYIAWALVMGLHQRPQTRRARNGERRRRRDDHDSGSGSSSSSSSSSSWSGGGGRSGGGGASGSW